MQAQFILAETANRLRLPRLHISRSVPANSQRFVLIQYGEQQSCLVEIDLAASEYAFVELAVVWRHWAVVGCGHNLHFIDPVSRRTRTHDLESYFCDLYITDDRLIASSAERVFCLDAAAQLRWRSEAIAVDGINLYKVDAASVQGSAERDPPGGWVGFAIDLMTGRTVAPAADVDDPDKQPAPPRTG